MNQQQFDMLQAEEERYCRSIRSPKKRRYAVAYVAFLLPWMHQGGPFGEPSRQEYGLSAMGAQAVRMQIFAILRRHEQAAGLHPNR